MNEAIAKEVLTWLQAARETVAEQAPLLANEIVRWLVIDSCLGLIVAGGLGAATYRFVRWCMRRRETARQNNSYDGDGYALTAALTGGIGSLIVFSLGISSLGYLVKALSAPRLAVLEQIGKLLP